MHPLFRKKFSHLFRLGKPNIQPFEKTFSKIPSLICTRGIRLHTQIRRMAENFLQFFCRKVSPVLLSPVWKNLSGGYAGKKEKRPVSRQRFTICSFSGRFWSFFRPVRRFEKAGKGKDTFYPVLRKCVFQGAKKAPVFLLQIRLKTGTT